MAVETIGEAFSLGWRVTASCSRGKVDHMTSSRECKFRSELDLETLVWTRGRAFPLSRLESRLRCPQCGSRHVGVMYEPPSNKNFAVAQARSRHVHFCASSAITSPRIRGELSWCPVGAQKNPSP
jgi:hypothetical protein